MSVEREFIDKILDYRQRGADIREAEEASLIAALKDFDRALGEMASFNAMNSKAFPVAVATLGYLPESEEMPDFGAKVTAFRSDGLFSRLYVQVRTRDADEFMTLTLHPGKAQTAKRWVFESSKHAFDGSDIAARSVHASAESALKAVRTKLLGIAVPLLSKGQVTSLPVLPDGDATTASIVFSTLEAAQRAGFELDALRKSKAEDIARTGHAINSIWHRTASSLSFLSELGFAPVDGAGMETIRTQSGITLGLDFGNGFKSSIIIEAVDTDPSLVGIRIEDSDGRKEMRCYLDVAEDRKIAIQIRTAVLAEIEDAEAAYLPENEPDQVRTPFM